MLGFPRRRPISSVMAKRHPRSEQRELFAPEPGLPGGFDYREALISPDEERALVERFASLPFQPFEFHGYLGKRRIVSFGWRYDYGGRALRESAAIPPFLPPLPLRAAGFAQIPPDGLPPLHVPEYC